MVTFYIEGNPATAAKAKAFYLKMLASHGNHFEGTDYEHAWMTKATSEESREIIENACECLLEVFIQE